MTSRRELLALFAATSLIRQAVSGQETPLRGLYRDYSRCLPDYLAELAGTAYRARNQELQKLGNVAAIQERQAWVSETFWRLVGGMPERSPLNARTLGAFERPGYRVEKVLYESQPELHISANLYVPTTGKPPYPGILFQMGHSTNGKAYVQYQRCCQGLARLGYVVLGFDPMGQGERTYYPGGKPFESAIGADEEHTRPGRQMLLYGDTSTRLQTWDSVRSLDYLAAHPLVDPKRLASTGQSGGGTNTMLLAAIDNRLAAAAISCPNTENVAAAVFNSPGSTDDAEQNFINAGPAGFARWDLLYPFAPKPLLVALSERDFFGTYSSQYIQNGLEEFGKLKQVYSTMGNGDHIEWYSTALPHGLAHDMRMQIYRWMQRWLQPEAAIPSVEPETSPETDETLYVAKSGSVLVDFGGATPFSINNARNVTRTPQDLRTLLALEELPGAPLTLLRKASYVDVGIEAVEVESAPHVWVPAYLFQPAKPRSQPAIILVLHPSGRTDWREGGLYHQLAAGGCTVCAPDLRNQGDLRPEFGRGARGHAASHNSEEHYAWASLILGKPLLGQRVADVLALVNGLVTREDFPGRRLLIAAQGFTTVPALCAAALDPRIGGLYLSGGLVSFENLVATRNYDHPFGNFVPDWLNHTDLPEIARSLAPRPVSITGAVDGAGKLISVSQAKAAHTKGDLPPHIQILPREPWDAATILSSTPAKQLGAPG